MIEELYDILEELADEAAVYGAERRSSWVSEYGSRITRAVAVEKAMERRCQCPIEDYRDLSTGDRCLVCGGHTR